MKNLISYLNEELNSSQNKRKFGGQFAKGMLINAIKKEIRENGPNCSLNHFDVSNFTDLSQLFCREVLDRFNGDISEWDVSNVTDMGAMFANS